MEFIALAPAGPACDGAVNASNQRLVRQKAALTQGEEPDSDGGSQGR
jgi:hypothetical protein